MSTPYDQNPDAAAEWPAAYIIAELMTRKDELGDYIADGDYEWSRQAVLHVRAAHRRGETLSSFACKWCEPGDLAYEEFNRRWARLGRPVQQPESHGE